MAANTPKTMSSRLMTMKFMQRSAPKSSNAEPSTPHGPPSKRVRLSNGISAPGTPGTPSEHEYIQPGLTAGEKRREEALAQLGSQAGETKWVLSFKDPHEGRRPPILQVRQAGFAVIDAEIGSDEDEDEKPARMQFGGGLKKKQSSTLTSRDTARSGSESDSDASPDETDSDDPTAQLIRETRREASTKERNARKAREAVAETPRRAPDIIDEDMDLAGLTSLSGGSRPSLGGRSNHNNVECFRCGQKGHMKDSCPNQSTPRVWGGRGGRGGRGRGRR